MIKVHSSEFNYQYGDQIHFPYRISSLIAYIRSKEVLNKNFDFQKAGVLRENVDEYIQECKDADILLCSCYVWNWEITNFLASEVRKINPNCTIVFGGAHVPDFSEDFFEEHPYVDILVHGEGEIVLEEFLTAYMGDKNYSDVKGLETKEFRNPPQDRINDLDSLPSAYLTNTVWDLVDKIDGINWIAGWETNRGCPYQCTFCDWGSATFTKVRKWEESKIFKEIEWFGENKIPYIDCCDANFGIFQERDFRIAKKLKEVALKTHYPDRVRPAWAKNSSEKIIPIAKELQEGDILGAVTLAVQSLDSNTLDIVKRANIKFDAFSELAEIFRNNGIPTYTELIMGLPGETLETFKDGLENIAQTKVDTVFIYNCSILPNAPMNTPEYKEKFKIESVRSPIMLVHSSIHNRGSHQEYEDIITSNIYCSLDQLKEIYLYSWCFLTLQSLGILEHITNFYNHSFNIEFVKFFEIFLEFCRTKESVFSEEYHKLVEFRDNGYAGKGWDQIDTKIGEIIWPMEEASWLRITYDAEKFLSGLDLLIEFVDEKLNLKNPKKILHDLTKFQLFMLTTRNNKDKLKTESFKFDWKNYFMTNSKLTQKNITYTYDNLVTESDEMTWSYKTIWYGRRSRDYKCQYLNLREEITQLTI
jgi:radical SAM superfamily enzyme YgiQ (UPF0313 family)